VVQLQGYVFFGTAHNLLARVKERITSVEPARVRFVLLDFRHVHGLDASAVVSFTRMKRLTETQGVTLIFTELPEGVRAQLERGGCLEGGAGAKDGAIRVFEDLDRGLQWCEDALLEAAEDRPATSEALRSELSSIVHDEGLVTRLLAYLERVEAKEGFDLFLAGDEAAELFLVESGEVEAWLKVAGGRERRLRSMGPGTVVGESALYLGGRRSASVRTTQPSVLYRLSGAALERMTSEAPELAAAFHRFVAAMLADRMVSTTSAAQMLFH
jgi:SulP family sulfate permease